MTHTQIYIFAVVASLWSLIWMIVGLHVGDRRGIANKGALLGLFLGPFGLLFIKGDKS